MRTMAITVPGLTTVEELSKLVMQKLGLRCTRLALVLDGRPLQLGKTSLFDAGVSNLATVSLVTSALCGGVSVAAAGDDSYQRMNPKTPRGRFAINEAEEEQRLQQEKTQKVDRGFFSFNWLKEEEGLPYDWAKGDKTLNDQLAVSDFKELALQESRQALYERFDIPKLDDDLLELKSLVDRMLGKIFDIKNDQACKTDKDLHVSFNFCDNGNKGYLTKAEFIGFFRLFCANNLQIAVTEKLAEQMILALDVDKDGLIRAEEVFKFQQHKCKQVKH